MALREAAILLAISLLATGGWWARSNDRLPLQADPTVYELELEAPLITVDAALEFYAEGMQLFIDTRDEPGSETISGALLIRAATFDDDLIEYFDFMLPEDGLILFGSGNLSRTSNIAGRLKERGYENVTILKGGLAAWKAGGGETSTAGAEAGS